MEEKRSQKNIIRWLETPEAQDVLRRTAQAIHEVALSRGLSYAHLHRDPFWRYPNANLHEEITSELGLFLIENASRFERGFTQEHRNAHVYLKRAFINHWISRSRRAGGDPKRHLRRRIHEILRGADAFHTMSEGSATVFSMTSDNRMIPPLVEEDLIEIPFPYEMVKSVDYDAINKKDVLLILAQHFWEAVSLLWGQKPVWVDVGDLVAWIGRHVPLTGPKVESERRDGESIFEGVPQTDSPPVGLYYDRDLVAAWARKFCNGLTPKQKEVYWSYYGQDRNLKQIKKTSGYQGSSGPSYVLDRIEEKVSIFVRDLPWLSPDDLNEEAFLFFLDTILSILKNEVSGP